jgi:hypothetical protein
MLDKEAAFGASLLLAYQLLAQQPKAKRIGPQPRTVGRQLNADPSKLQIAA